MGNEELVRLYEKRLGDAGYLCYKLGRTNNRGDGKHILLDSGLLYGSNLKPIGDNIFIYSVRFAYGCS